MATFPAAQGREVPVREAPSQAMPSQAMPFPEVPARAMPFPEVPVRVASGPALVRAALVREVALRGPVREDRARAPRTEVHHRTAGLARPGSPGLRDQAD